MLLKVLNIGAGKSETVEELAILNQISKTYNYDASVRLFLDKSYFIHPNNKEEVIYQFENYVEKLHGFKEEHFYSNCDAFEFMERTRAKFDIVILNRVLEHIPKDKVLYFIYLLSTITIPKHSTISIIVPDYNLLAKMLIKEDVTSPMFEKLNILLTSEILNEPSDPHVSIWTSERLDYFFTYENRFQIHEMTKNFKFDKRDIYIHALIKGV